MSCNDWKWEKDIDVEYDQFLYTQDIENKPLSSVITIKKTLLSIESLNIQEIHLKHVDPLVVLE